MVIATARTVAIICPDCGCLSWHVLSLFTLGRQGKCFACECGVTVLTIERKKGHYWFQTKCALCEIEHIQAFTRKEMMATMAQELYCQETDYVTGCIGSQAEVKEYFKTHRRSLTNLALEAGPIDYFQNPDVMFGILDRLYEMAESGDLHCYCGSKHLELNVRPEQLELRCQDCAGEIMVPAQLPEDLENFLVRGLSLNGEQQSNFWQQKKLQRRKRNSIKSY